MLGFVLLVAVSCHLAPHLTRREIFFGVTVASSFRDDPAARSISRRYAVEVWLLAAAAALFVGTSPMPVVSGPMLLAQSVGAFVAFVRARDAARPYAVAPAMIREAEIGPRPGLPGGFIGQIGPFLILLATAVYLGLRWDDIPAKFPTHWNLTGRPDGWTTKSVAGVFRGVSVGIVVCGMTLFTSYAVMRWTRLARVAGAEGERSRRVRRVNLLASLAGEYLIALLLAWTSVISMFAARETQPRLPLALRVAPFALFLVAGSVIHAMRRTAAEGAPIGDTTPDACWWFGTFYANRADPALFVEKRSGLGYTLNLGNALSWLVMLVGIVALSIPLLLVP
jgi:uncharacterized membrane protein